MRQIKQNNKTHSHFDRDLIGNFIYIQKNDKISSSHHIFKLTDIIDSTYVGSKHYFFHIPVDRGNRAFCYDGIGQIDIAYNDKIFVIDEDEYLDTFRSFVRHDGYRVSDLPDKVVKDK